MKPPPRIWMLACIALQAMLLAWFANAYITLAMAVVGFALATWNRRPLTRRNCSWLAFGGSVLLLGKLLAFGLPVVDDALGVAGSWWFAIAEFLVLLQLIELLREWRDDRPPEYFSSLALASFFCLFNQANSEEERRGFILIAILASTLIVVASGALRRRPSEDRQRRMLLIVTLVAAGLLTWAFADRWLGNVATIRGWFASQLQAANVRRRGIRLYTGAASLKSVSFEKKTNPDAVALRVFSDATPGYLRGRVFDSYAHGKWRNTEWGRRRWDRLEGLTRLAPVEGQSDLPKPKPGERTFALRDGFLGARTAVEVWNDPRRGEMYFTPIGTTHVRGVGGILGVDATNVVHSGLKTDKPYTAYVPQRWRTRLSDRQRSRFTARLAGLDPKVTALAEKVCAEQSTPAGKIEAVEEYFKDNFSYSLDGFAVPADEEPLSYFLLNRPPSHCEFFASGAVALLRQQGVPARYVTGYVATELESEYGDYWLARNRNAHAWVEAYDDQRQRWVVVEPTPGVIAPKSLIRINASSAQSLAEVFSLDYPILGRRWLWIRFLLLIELASGPLLVSVTFLIIAWTVYRVMPSRGTDPFRDFHKLLRRMDRRARRFAFVRRPSETVAQFASRLRASAMEDDRIDRLADWYEHYARVRFSPNPDVGDILRAELRSPCASWFAAWRERFMLRWR